MPAVNSVVVRDHSTASFKVPKKSGEATRGYASINIPNSSLKIPTSADAVMKKVEGSVEILTRYAVGLDLQNAKGRAEAKAKALEKLEKRRAEAEAKRAEEAKRFEEVKIVEEATIVEEVTLAEEVKIVEEAEAETSACSRVTGLAIAIIAGLAATLISCV